MCTLYQFEERGILHVYNATATQHHGVLFYEPAFILFLCVEYVSLVQVAKTKWHNILFVLAICRVMVNNTCCV